MPFQLLARRVLLGLCTIFATLALVFVIIRLVPSDPASMLLLADATPEQLAALRKLWGLDQPIPTQFFIYVSNLLQGNAGDSYQYQRVAGLPGTPAFGLVMSRLPATAWLAVVALSFSILIAVPLGVLAALWKDSILDKAVLLVASVLSSIPAFFSGILLIVFFALNLRILPTGGSELPQSVILPGLALSLTFAAVLLRVTRTEMGRVMASEYVVTARAKGLRRGTVVWVHAFKNAVIPLITVIGLRLGDLLAGAVVVETLFRWPGIGRLMIDSIVARDYPVVQVVIPLAAFVFVAVNIAVDLVYGAVDPRAREGATT
ncbi:peptide/nickel transport system permease protein/oligopeptide transport system permease protein [Devosia sp. YR412]|uniref:ABC transporter permease n=1 Tax=Devosia sp. YR412 TaxID=1881030 RepID=UPI0008B89AF3|nr:ABC transporter permease [Devosia sp. YR412]SEQ10677.1 peptide/nickel transport system permease protein/oligopeptide transport system permease protein [Devosia sp. YR412]